MNVMVSSDLTIARNLFSVLAERTRDTVGITRESYGRGESIAAEIIEACAMRHGLAVERDAAANLVITLPGRDSAAPFFACGSHLDSVPQGGNFDGAAGVVAGLLTLIRMRREGIVPSVPVRVYGLRGEESAWYGRAYTGSKALFGLLSDQDLDARHAAGGRTLRQAMACCGADIEHLSAGIPILSRGDIAGWLELHIEQGPVLAARNQPVAIVSAIRGNVRHRSIACIGEAGHSGAVPRELRHDAVFAVADLLTRIDNWWRSVYDNGADLVLTSGMLGTLPSEHAISRIPGEVQFSFEARSQDDGMLDLAVSRLVQECEEVTHIRGVQFRFDSPVRSAPALLDAGLIDRLQHAMVQQGIPDMVMPSGAGHDAAVFANMGVPSAMIFVRNDHGSHNPAEAMEMDDFMIGVNLLYSAMVDAATGKASNALPSAR